VITTSEEPYDKLCDIHCLETTPAKLMLEAPAALQDCDAGSTSCSSVLAAA